MNEWIEITAKTVEEALTQASLELGTSSDNMEYEVVEHESKGILGMFSKDAKIKVKLKDSVENNVKSFLSRVFKCMNIDAKLDVLYDEEGELVEVNVHGDDMGVLIGKRGQTLDSLQYLTSLVINKNSEGYIKVKIDTENYRERRKDTLENLAKNIAFKVKRTKKPVSLEPMNPYERRVIHAALQNDRYVVTRSEGEEPYRHVVISLKREKTYNNRSNGGKGGYNRYNSSYKKGGYNRNKDFNRETTNDTVSAEQKQED